MKLAYRLTLLLLIIIVSTYAWSRIRSRSQQVTLFGQNDATIIQSDSAQLSVIAYNIAHARGPVMGESNWTGTADERADRARQIGDMLAFHSADIVILNEVDFATRWAGHINHAEIIMETAGYPQRAEQRNIDVAFPFAQFRFGNAILSKYPIIEASAIQFTELHKPYERWLAGNHDALQAVVETPAGRVRFIAVHLEVRSYIAQIAAAKEILEIVDGSAEPTIIAGDFNTAPTGFDAYKANDAGENTIELFDKQFVRQPLEENAEAFTFPSANPNRTIDWILVQSPLTIDAQTVIQSDLSDHLPVFATINFSSSGR